MLVPEVQNGRYPKVVRDTLPQTGDASKPEGWELSQLIQLHVAEYQAVTTRNTYWVTLQYALGPITVGAFVVLVEGRSFVSGSLLSWATAVFFDLIMLVYYGILYEIYNNTRYLECELGREIRNLFPGRRFWLYERYLRARKSYPPWWDFSPMVLCVGAPCAAAFFRRTSWLVGDWIGLGVCLVLTAMALRLALGSVKAQREFRGAS